MVLLDRILKVQWALLRFQSQEGLQLKNMEIWTCVILHNMLRKLKSYTDVDWEAVMAEEKAAGSGGRLVPAMEDPPLNVVKEGQRRREEYQDILWMRKHASPL